jgi:membrane protease subunit HflC
MKSAISSVAIIIGLALLIVLSGVFYVVPETEQVVITQFGQPKGEPVKTAGLKLKIPFIQHVNRVERRIIEWDGPSAEMPTRDKLYIVVDAFGRWQISDPLQFFLRLRDERSAQSRLDDILGSEMRNTIARNDLVEVIRTTKGRKPVQDDSLGAEVVVATLPPIRNGRVALEQEVYEAAKGKLAEFGIELLDVRFKRINYNAGVATKIFDRMTSERRQIAERFRSEGAGEAAKIIGQKERDLRAIESEAYRQSEVIKGKADAEATAIYAAAYNQSDQAREFYAFTRALETYRASLSKGTTMLMTTDSDLLRYLKGIDVQPSRPEAPATAPVQAASPPAPTPAVPVEP